MSSCSRSWSSTLGFLAVQAGLVALHLALGLTARPLLLLLNKLTPAPRAPPARIRPTEIRDLRGTVDSLPRPGPLPESIRGQTVGFSGCANLCFYSFGCLACLQAADRDPATEPGVLRSMKFAGASSGALAAALASLDIDTLAALPLLLEAMERLRVHGVGLPMRSSPRFCPAVVVPLIASLIDAAPDLYRRANGRCGIAVTWFEQLSLREHILWQYDSNQQLVARLRASSGAPIQWPFPTLFSFVWPLGVVVDGAMSADFVPCDIKVSPYPVDDAHVGRRESYTRDDFAVQISAIPPSDVLALFEDGWRDCCSWLDKTR